MDGAAAVIAYDNACANFVPDDGQPQGSAGNSPARSRSRSPALTQCPMKTIRLAATLLLASACPFAQAAGRLAVTVTRDLADARPAETVVVPWSEVAARLPGLVFDQVIVRDATGVIVPAQVTAFNHVHKGPPQYDDLVFQHDFAAGEQRATFVIEASAVPPPVFPSRVFARYVPERLDDFAWENDRVAHRIYGPALELPAATKDQMTSSGIDLWAKRVGYPIVDRWYHKGHDGLHTDTGEGLDMYEVGTSRGVGGTGVWDGHELHVSRNWRTWRVLANGPLRAVFELGYEPWDAGRVGSMGNGVMVAETKRFVVDAGSNLDEIASTFDFKPPKGGDSELTVAIGLTKHERLAQVVPAQDGKAGWISLWEEYHNPADGNLGTAVVLAPDARFAGIIETPDEWLLLVKVKPGETVRYFAGGGWDKSGDFADAAAWNHYLAAFAARLRAPAKVTLSPAP